MPQSLSQVVLHIVFSTKNRDPSIREEHLPSLHAYLAAVARNKKWECYRAGGVSDHVHIALRMPRTDTISSVVETLKTSTSKWLKTQSPSLRDFSWQTGYGAFSIHRRDLEVLVSYIDRQADHHRKKSFQEEYLELLREFGVEYDERYLWD